MKNLIKKAEKNTDTVMPGLTHLKNAQPISFAHYLLSYYEMLKRDQKRFENNIKLIDECPLGSAALSGTSYKIDRSYTAKKLGFKKPTNNSIDSVSDRDFAIDFLYASAVCAMHLSRLAEDFIIYNSDAFALISFNDNMLTGSSIMPQKKNPDPAELIRGKVGVSYGKLNSMLTIMKGLPMSYFKDLQDDKEIVFDGYDTLKDTLTMSAELINAVIPIKTNMLEMANKGYTTATDFADYLVKEKHLSFRESYAVSAKLVNFAEKNKKKLSELSLEEVKKVYKDLDKKVLNVILKSDVAGTSEAIVAALVDIGNDDASIKVVASGVGGISESDANLALATDSIILGFNVRSDNAAKKIVEGEELVLSYHSIIYELIDEVKARLSGLLDPIIKEEIVGTAEVLEVFNSPKFGQVAGCMVIEGSIFKSKPVRVLRDDVVIHQGELDSLRRFKDDIGEVKSGTECGVGIKNYKDIRPGDKVEVFDRKEEAQSIQ